MTDAAALIHAIAQGALGGQDQDALVVGLAEGLVAAGLPLRRLLVGSDMLHPLYEGRGYLWKPDDGLTVTQQDRDDAEIDSVWRRSPIYRLYTTDETAMRRRLDASYTRGEYLLLDELQDAGTTDYLLLGAKLHGRFALGTIDFLFASFSTDDPAGFAEEHVGLLKVVMPVFALAFNGLGAIGTAKSLLDIYLGSDASRRVLAGNVVRGRAETVRAAIWFSDLEGFTGIADTASANDVLRLLNDYADCQAQVIQAHGGQVLKFIGDGLLAIFPGDDADACGRALDATRDLTERLAQVDAARVADGQPLSRLRLALHVGDLLFGNFGSLDRLDFTVVGPAVNEASRIEAMCKSLGQWLLASNAFHAALGPRQRELVSTGRYMLRSVARPQELFTLDPAP